MTFKSRDEFRYKLLMSGGIDPAADRPILDGNAIRRKLLILCQETRYRIYQLLRGKRPGLTRGEISTGLNIPTDKLYYHLYVLLNEGILQLSEMPAEDARFVVNQEFAQSAVAQIDNL